MKYQECNKIVKQKAFERAIASDETKKSVVDSLDIENMSRFLYLKYSYISTFAGWAEICDRIYLFLRQ